MTKNSRISVKEITPREHRCGVGMCPSVFDTNDGDLLIIGKVIANEEIPPIVSQKVGNDETVIRVPKSMIFDLLKEQYNG